MKSPNSYSAALIYSTQPGANGTHRASGQNSSSQCAGANGRDGVPGAQNPILVFSPSLGRPSPGPWPRPRTAPGPGAGTSTEADSGETAL